MAITNPDLTITHDARNRTGWVKGLYKGRYFEAKVYDEPSDYGVPVNSGPSRTSKLCISRDAAWTGMNRVLFNYDRGMDLDHPLGHELAAVLEAL